MDTLIAGLRDRFPSLATSAFRGQARLTVERSSLFALLTALQEEHDFDFLVDLTCVDYLDYPADAAFRPLARFCLVYLLADTRAVRRLEVRSYLAESALNARPLSVPSVVGIWRAADWLEREVWDLFGIRFDGHPDLRRIVLPEEFEAHPLRKDYPLQGRGERHHLPRVDAQFLALGPNR